MAFSIGRAGKTLVLNDPSMWSEANGSATVTIITRVSPATDALRLRDQLLGYVDNWDEPIVPVICDMEPRRTGYYRVTGVQIDTDPEAVGLGFFTAYVSLAPVMGFSQPFLESILSGALLTNGVGAVLADVHAFHSVPAVATEYGYAGVQSVFSLRVSADGSLIFLDTGQTLSSTARSGLAPSSFYVGAATFEQGSALQPVVGRMLAQADLVNWRLSNGLVRVTPNATAGKLDVSHYDGAQWDAVKTYAISATYTPLAAPDQSVEVCTLITGGAMTAGQSALASFKPATTIALRGSLGAFATTASSPITPAFGQATAAGNLLIAWVGNNNGGTMTASAGWTLAVQSGTAYIWYKPNCGAGEAAPTFTSAGAAYMTAQLAEFTGAALAAPVDKTGTVSASFAPGPPAVAVSVNASATDGTGNDLVVTATRWGQATAGTVAIGGFYNNATRLTSGDDGLTSGTRHSCFGYGIIGTTVPATITGLNSLTILRNSVEETAIRLSLATSIGNTAGIVLADLSLRRGDRLVRIFLQSSNLSLTFKLARDTTEAATAITYGAVTLGGIRATADDGDGNRYVILSYQRATPVSDLVNGAITQGAAGLVADYAIGSEIGGSTANANLDDAASLAKQYLASQSESQRIVAR